MSSFIGSCCVFFVLPLLAVVGFFLKQSVDTLGYLKAWSLKFDTDHGSFGAADVAAPKCTLVGGFGGAPPKSDVEDFFVVTQPTAIPTPVEDVTVYDSSRGLLFGGGGRVWDAYLYSVKGVREGRGHADAEGEADSDPTYHANNIHLIDVTERQVWALRTFKKNVDTVFLTDQERADGTEKQEQFSAYDLNDHLFHGVHYSKTTKRLYIVNHREAYSCVEIFEVRDEGSDALRNIIDTQADATATSASPSHVNFHSSMFLVHLHTVTADLDTFRRYGLNDIVETSSDGSSFFVSEWQTGDLDLTTEKGLDDQSVLHKLQHKANILLKMEKTRLLKCSVDASDKQGAEKPSWSCGEATSDRFVGTNGLAITSDKRFLFISDPPAGLVHIYDTQSAIKNPSEDAPLESSSSHDGTDGPASQTNKRLRRVVSFAPSHLIDNLEVVERNHDKPTTLSSSASSPAVIVEKDTADSTHESDLIVLHAGTIVLPHASITGCHSGFGMSQVVSDGKGQPGLIGCGRSPGGLLEIRIRGLYSNRRFSEEEMAAMNITTPAPEHIGDVGEVEIQMEDLILHDGSVLSDVSSAISVQNRAVFGSPKSKGIMICDL